MTKAADRRAPTEDTPSETEAFEKQLEAWQLRMEAALDKRLPSAGEIPTRLHEAMRYSVLGGGKRIRPALLFATALTLGLTEDEVEAAACAIELIHVYSLVHDDLPAMDDDDLRRGQPTTHRAFDEATAILAGDSLQVLAFSLLARDRTPGVSAEARLRMIQILADASGTAGMAGGQAIDLSAVGRNIGLEELEAMHRLKTGALIRASVLMAAACAPGLSDAAWEALDGYSQDIGLAFQIQDDILDVEGDTEEIGKTSGADAARAKPTYPSVLGLSTAKLRASELEARAYERLAPLGEAADVLGWLASFVVKRRA